MLLFFLVWTKKDPLLSQKTSQWSSISFHPNTNIRIIFALSKFKIIIIQICHVIMAAPGVISLDRIHFTLQHSISSDGLKLLRLNTKFQLMNINLFYRRLFKINMLSSELYAWFIPDNSWTHINTLLPFADVYLVVHCSCCQWAVPCFEIVSIWPLKYKIQRLKLNCFCNKP